MFTTVLLSVRVAGGVEARVCDVAGYMLGRRQSISAYASMRSGVDGSSLALCMVVELTNLRDEVIKCSNN